MVFNNQSWLNASLSDPYKRHIIINMKKKMTILPPGIKLEHINHHPELKEHDSSRQRFLGPCMSWVGWKIEGVDFGLCFYHIW